VASRSALGRDNGTPELAADWARAGASWPSATAARVLARLRGVQVSQETLRQRGIQIGHQEAAAQQREAERLLGVTAADGRTARAAAARQQRGGQPVATAPAPARLVVGVDGGWVPSRDPAGGM
jgi:hypothetical protein